MVFCRWARCCHLLNNTGTFLLQFTSRKSSFPSTSASWLYISTFLFIFWDLLHIFKFFLKYLIQDSEWAHLCAEHTWLPWAVTLRERYFLAQTTGRYPKHLKFLGLIKLIDFEIQQKKKESLNESKYQMVGAKVTNKLSSQPHSYSA